MNDTTTNNAPTEILQMLGQLLDGPILKNEATKEPYYALVRAVRRLGALREELQNTSSDALDSAKAAYSSILSSVVIRLDEAGKSEIERLAMCDTVIESFPEIRIAVAQLHGWLENVVSGMETKRDAEQMLGGTLEKILQDATLVAKPAEAESMTHGSYL